MRNIFIKNTPEASVARRIAVRYLALALAIASPAKAAPGSAPPSPAALNIKPIYEDLWLPTSYAPGKYRCDSGSVSANSANPPRKTGRSQSFLQEVPFPSHGGKIDPGSNVDDWKRVNISSMTLYATAQNAHDAMLYHAYPSCLRQASFGDEALFRGWEERPWPEPAGLGRKLYDKDHEWDMRSTEGIVRVGRVAFDISIRGSLMVDRVDADTGKGFKSFQGFVTIAEAPTRAELEQDLSQFTAAIKSYAGAMGWLTDLPAGVATPGKLTSGITHSQPTTGKPSGSEQGSEITGDNSSSTGNGKDNQDDPSSPLTPGQAAGASVAAGLLAAIGSLLFTRTMGVSFSNLTDIFSNTSLTPPPQPEPPRILFQEPPHQDGDVNEKGEVWDASLPGWVGRNLYEQDRQQRIDLVAKDVSDRIASRSQDADVNELYIKAMDSMDKLQEIRKAGLKQEADWARGDLEQLFNKEMQKGPIAPERAVLFANIWNKIQDAQESDDYAGGLDDLQQVGNIIQGQGRATYEPTYTTRDLAEDAVMRVGATVLDLGGGGGYANAAISFLQGARDCVRHGADTATAIMEGSKNALLEIATFKVGVVGERLGFDPLKVIAATTGATRGATTMRDALERGDSLAKAATKGFFEGSVNAAATFGIGKVMEKPSAKLSDVVWGPKPTAPVIGAPEDPHIAEQIANAKRNITIGNDGKKYMDLDDALRLQQETTVTDAAVDHGLAEFAKQDWVQVDKNDLCRFAGAWQPVLMALGFCVGAGVLAIRRKTADGISVFQVAFIRAMGNLWSFDFDLAGGNKVFVQTADGLSMSRAVDLLIQNALVPAVTAQPLQKEEPPPLPKVAPSPAGGKTFCSQCGIPLDPKGRFCAACGAAV